MNTRRINSLIQMILNLLLNDGRTIQASRNLLAALVTCIKLSEQFFQVCGSVNSTIDEINYRANIKWIIQLMPR